MKNQKTDKYFKWLLSQIKATENEKYYQVLLDLHRQVFFSKKPNDDNRAVDGIKLREIFAMEYDLSSEELLEGPCTMLEMLVALSARMDHILYDYNLEDQTPRWFWMILGNLNLLAVDKSQRTWKYKQNKNRLIIEKFLKREYDSNGKGGLFPLRHPKEDQRDVEIWYQMMNFINEMG